MSDDSTKTRLAAGLGTDRYLTFWCSGCGEPHSVPVAGEKAWQWNGERDRPTLAPSILIRYPAYPTAAEGFEQWRTERVCHSFVRDGRIQYLGDCTHALAGKTIDLPDFQW